MRREEPAPAEAFIEAVIRLAWGLRVEIILGGGAISTGALAAAHLSPICGVIVVAGLVTVSLGVAPVRRLLGRILSRARLRRRWHRGLRTARIPAFEPQLPAGV